MLISHLDHLVLTVKDVQASCVFYQRVLGMAVQRTSGTRWALHFGSQKINLHQRGQEFKPHAARPTSGSADVCFIAAPPIEAVVTHLTGQGVEIIDGPVERTGALGPITSVYFRDPDANLIEVACYAKPPAGVVF